MPDTRPTAPGAPTGAPAAVRAPRGVLAVVAAGTLLSAMSGSMLMVALPSIGRDLAVSIGASRWVVQAFLLTSAVLLLPAGRLGDALGYGRTYVAGMSLFGAGALGAGLAPTFGLLVACRILQGFGAAAAMAVGPAILTTAVPPSRRGQALGALATATYLGLTIGPPLAGAILARFDWRWTFFVFVAPVALVLAASPRAVPLGGRVHAVAVDWRGVGTLGVALPALLIALSEGPPGRIGPGFAVLLGGIGLLGAVVFVAVERGGGERLLDLSLFGSPVFTGSVLSALGNYVTLFMMTLLIPFYLEEGLGVGAGMMGLLLAIQPLVMAAVAAPAGWLSDRIGTRLPAAGGMLILALGTAWLSFLGAGRGPVDLIVPLALVGLGTGVFISPNSSALMGSAPRARQGTAGGVLAEARIVGMLLGVATGTTLFQAAGGVTGRAWDATEFTALSFVLRIAAGVAVLAAAAAALRPRLPLRPPGA